MLDLVPNDSAVSENEIHPQSINIYPNQEESKVYVSGTECNYQKRNFCKGFEQSQEYIIFQIL